MNERMPSLKILYMLISRLVLAVKKFSLRKTLVKKRIIMFPSQRFEKLDLIGMMFINICCICTNVVVISVVFWSTVCCWALT